MSDSHLRSEHVKARKEYYCYWCNEKIKKDEKHEVSTSIFEGEIGSTRMHLECEQAINESTKKDWEIYDDGIPQGIGKRGLFEIKDEFKGDYL